MWESYRMDEAVWKEDGDTKNQDNYPQQNHAPDSVALSPENDTTIRKYNTEKRTDVQRNISLKKKIIYDMKTRIIGKRSGKQN